MITNCSFKNSPNFTATIKLNKLPEDAKTLLTTQGNTVNKEGSKYVIKQEDGVKLINSVLGIWGLGVIEKGKIKPTRISKKSDIPAMVTGLTDQFARFGINFEYIA